MWRRYLPFLVWWPEVDRDTLRADLTASVTGAVVVLPQGVAFATIAGMPPEYGLYAAMVPAVVAALFGSSRVMISGPATPVSIVLFSALATLAAPGGEVYVQLAITLTFMVGVLQLALGLGRLGYLVNFISHSVVVGFSAGAAIVIAASQTGAFLGIDLPRGLGLPDLATAVWQRHASIDPATVLVGVFSIAAGMISRRLLPAVPFMIVAIVAGTALALALNEFMGASIARVSAAATALPPLSAPSLDLTTLRDLAPAALALTVFALSQAVSIARSVAARTGDIVDGNQEFIGQGLSNILGSFFSGYVSTGSFNRTGVNYEAGARTPLASVFTALLLVLVLFGVAPLLSWMPKAATAGVLFLVAIGIVDVRQIRTILRTSRADTVVMSVTFVATILVSMDFAILLGVMVSLVIFLNRSSQPRVLVRVPDPRLPHRRFATDPKLPECPQVKIISIDGALFFGAAFYVAERLRVMFARNPEQKHLLVLARSIGFIDASGAEVIGREHRKRKAMGGGVYFHQLSPGARRVLERGGYLEEISADHLFDTKGDAIAAIFGRLNRNVCARCTKRIFNECKMVPRPPGPGAGT